MRLRAVKCVLKLANVKVFDKSMSDFFEPVAGIVQVGYTCHLASPSSYCLGRVLDCPIQGVAETGRGFTDSAITAQMEYHACHHRRRRGLREQHPRKSLRHLSDGTLM